MAAICGYVSPQGEFFPCNPYGHTKLAQEIVEKKALRGLSVFPEQILARHGFMTVNQCMVGIDYCGEGYCFYKHLTEPQVKWVVDHMEQFNHMQLISAKSELEY